MAALCSPVEEVMTVISYGPRCGWGWRATKSRITHQSPSVRNENNRNAGKSWWVGDDDSLNRMRVPHAIKPAADLCETSSEQLYAGTAEPTVPVETQQYTTPFACWSVACCD